MAAKSRENPVIHTYVGLAGIRDDLGIFFRSRWEANYARVLNLLGILWLYEPTRFTTPYGSYAPDFYLPEREVYVEVKGRESDNRQKVKRDWLVEQGILILEYITGNEYEVLPKAICS